MVVWFIFLGIVGERGMGKNNKISLDSGNDFQASLNVALLAWQDLNGKLADLNQDQGKSVDATDIIQKFQECAKAATEVCRATKPKEINPEDRKKIGAIITGEAEGEDGLTVLFEEFQKQLTLNSEQRKVWDTLKRQVLEACRGLDGV